METLFTDTFEVHAVNPEHKVFDRIDRLKAKAETYDCDLTLDINSQLWKVKEDQKIVLQLTASLTGAVDDGTYRDSDEASLLDMVSGCAKNPTLVHPVLESSYQRLLPR